MRTFNARKAFILLGLAWPLAIGAVMLLWPGSDGQRGLASELLGTRVEVAEPALPRERESDARVAEKAAGTRMFWVETKPGEYKGVIDIPPEELNDGQAPAIAPAAEEQRKIAVEKKFQKAAQGGGKDTH